MKKLLIFLGIFLGAPGVVALMLHYKWLALTIAVLVFVGVWSVVSYAITNNLIGISRFCKNWERKDSQ